MWCSAIQGIAMLILSLIATPRTFDAQPMGEVRRIGFLTPGVRALTATPSRFEAFTHALRTLLWMEGQNLVIESRYAEGMEERLPRCGRERLRPGSLPGQVR